MSRFAGRLSFLMVFALASCMHSGSSAAQGALKVGQWHSMFDGKTMPTEWRGYKMTTMPPGWSVENGTLTKSKTTEDIISVAEFSDFEFEVDWKLEKGGNSGLFYRGSEEFDRVYWSATEYQLLDDANAPDGKNRLTSAGSAYGLYAPPVGIVKPFGEWNSTRIVVKGTHVEHWMNGKKLLEYTYYSPDWEAKVKASKFKTWAKYGRASKGHLAIQGDHNGALTLRNIRIKPL
ncbi:MAG: DUF1080 domain-containing protein [Gemmatimonadaceae bacterium]